MEVNLEAIREATRKVVGDDIDLSPITEKLVLEARENGNPVTILAGRDDGNTFMRDGNNWRWRKNCSPKPKRLAVLGW
jgi:hypothetical protein